MLMETPPKIDLLRTVVCVSELCVDGSRALLPLRWRNRAHSPVPLVAVNCKKVKRL